MLPIVRSHAPRRVCLAVGLQLCLLACLTAAQSTVLPKLPGLVSDVRLGEPGEMFNPQTLAVSPNGKTFWVAGNSSKGRDNHPWLKEVDASGRVVRDVDVVALLGMRDGPSASGIRFKVALALPTSVVLAVDLSPEHPVVIAINQEGKIMYRTDVFGNSRGSITSLRADENQRVLALGQKKINGEFHAALVVLNAQGAVIQERTERKESYSSFNDLVVTTSGQRILVGQASGMSKDEELRVWMVRTDETYRILEESLIPGVVDAATAGERGRFVLCVVADPNSSRQQEVDVIEFDANLREQWRTTIFRTARRGFPFSCKIASVPGGGYVAAAQGIDPGPSVIASRLDAAGKIAWAFVEPTSKTSYTWHWRFADFDSTGRSYFILTELLNPPGGGSATSRIGLLHFQITN